MMATFLDSLILRKKLVPNMYHLKPKPLCQFLVNTPLDLLETWVNPVCLKLQVRQSRVPRFSGESNTWPFKSLDLSTSMFDGVTRSRDGHLMSNTLAALKPCLTSGKRVGPGTTPQLYATTASRV